MAEKKTQEESVLAESEVRIRPLALIITVRQRIGRDEWTIGTSTPHGNMEWGTGLDFPDRDAAYNVACAIQENIAGSSRIDG